MPTNSDEIISPEEKAHLEGLSKDVRGAIGSISKVAEKTLESNEYPIINEVLELIVTGQYRDEESGLEIGLNLPFAEREARLKNLADAIGKKDKNALSDEVARWYSEDETTTPQVVEAIKLKTPAGTKEYTPYAAFRNTITTFIIDTEQ